MKILLITTHLNVGGITSYLFALCRQYVAKGHQVFLVSCGGARKHEFKNVGVVLLKAAVGTKSEVSFRMYCDLPRLLKFIRKNEIEIIHSHTRVTQFLGQALSFFSGVSFVTTCHGFYRTHWFRKTFPCWGKAVVAISPPVMDHLVNDFKVPQEQIFLINNGIDLESFQAVDDANRQRTRREFNISQTPVIGMVSRLADVKGHSVLIHAMPCIISKFPDVLLFLAGEGKMRVQLEAQVAALGIAKHVMFASVFNPSGAILSLFDVFVMPSLEEGFGLSGMEAQAAGLPIVASNVGGIPLFVFHEKTGLLVEPKNPKALADAIIRFLKDPDFAKRIGAEARKFIQENFSSEITATKTLEMYQKVLEKR